MGPAAPAEARDEREGGAADAEGEEQGAETPEEREAARVLRRLLRVEGLLRDAQACLVIL